MKTILVCNSKGGVGKSLIADELAFSFERTNTPMAFYDLDSQGGTLHKTNNNPNAQVAVVDTPGALQQQLIQYMKAADVVVIPTRTTSRDIEPLQRMQEAVRANAPKAKVIYVLNGFNRFRASQDFLEWFQTQAKGNKIIQLPQSESFVQASAYKQSVVEYSRFGKAVDATKELCNTVREAIGLPKEA